VLPAVGSYSATKGNAVARRVEELFRGVVECFYDHRPAATRYVLQVEHGYFVLTFDADAPRFHWLDGQSALLRYLGAPQKEFSPVVFDRHARADRLLPVIFEVNVPGIVQFFYRPVGGQVEIYVLDERGSLFFRRSAFFDADALLSQYSHFFEAVLNRVNFLMQEGRNVRGAEGLEFYSVESDGVRLRLERQRPRFHAQGTQYLSLQVIVEADDEGKPSFVFFCNGREFASSDRGARALEEVVRYVLELRRSGQHYPIYITDISMSSAVLGEEGTDRVQTVNFLTYKHRIEEKLNQAMAQAGGNPV
jgi:adenylate cyclase class 1